MGWLGGFDSLGLRLSSEELAFQAVAARQVTLPLLGSSGAVLTPLVDKGNLVKEGAVLAQDGEDRLLSPFEGEVEGLVTVPHPAGLRAVRAIRLTVTGSKAPEKAVEPVPNPMKAEHSALWEAISAAGLRGFAWDGTYSEAMPRDAQTKPERLVINAADQDLGLMARAQLLRDSEPTLAKAVALLKEMTGAKKALVAVLATEAEKAKSLLSYLKADAEVFSVKPHYPSSHDRLVAYQAGTGSLVLSLEWVLAVYDALALGKLPAFCPLTVVDAKGEKTNVRVPVGTSARDVLESLNLDVLDGQRLLFGGALSGRAQFSLDAPILFGVTGLTILPAEEGGIVPSRSCVNCGDCINACPVGLQPHQMGRQCEFGLYADVQNLDLCILCGLCSYVCPANRPLKQWFELARKVLKAPDAA